MAKACTRRGGGSGGPNGEGGAVTGRGTGRGPVWQPARWGGGGSGAPFPGSYLPLPASEVSLQEPSFQQN